jgi:hypothetical protein
MAVTIIICIVLLIVGRRVSFLLGAMAAESWGGCLRAGLIAALILAGIAIYGASVMRQAGWIQ